MGFIAGSDLGESGSFLELQTRQIRYRGLAENVRQLSEYGVVGAQKEERPYGKDSKEFALRGFSAKSTRVNITDLLSQERVFRFVRFATVGGSVAVIDFGGVAIASHFLTPLLAVTVAYFIAVCCHFLLNKYWVFRCRRNDYAKQLFQYGGVILTNWLITIGVVHFCLSTFTTNVLIAKLCAIPCATMCNFLLMQLVVFRAHRAEENPADLSYSSSMAEMD